MLGYKLEIISECSNIVLIQKLFYNDECYFDEFCKDITNEGTYADELDQIFVYLEVWGNDGEIPKKKYKELSRDRNDKIKDFELRTSNLRIYYIKGEGKNLIIIYGGKKSNYIKDIKRMRRIKIDYKSKKL